MSARPRGSVRPVFRRAKAAGMSPLKVWAEWKRSREQAAQTNHWRLSELAATVTDDWEDFVAVFGKESAALVLKNLAGAAVVERPRD